MTSMGKSVLLVFKRTNLHKTQRIDNYTVIYLMNLFRYTFFNECVT